MLNQHKPLMLSLSKHEVTGQCNRLQVQKDLKRHSLRRMSETASEARRPRSLSAS